MRLSRRPPCRKAPPRRRSRPSSEPSAAGETEIKGTGESISGYKSFTIHYEDDTESAIQRGVEGLTYTLEGVQVFDSIKDAGVDMYGCTVDSEDILGLPFVLVELKADYTAPAGGEGEVIADANDLTPMIQMDRLEEGSEPAFPVLGYFSLRPKEGDAKLDSQHQAFCYIIKDGESVTFQLGVFCDRTLLDAKDLYLEVNAVPAPRTEAPSAATPSSGCSTCWGMSKKGCCSSAFERQPFYCSDESHAVSAVAGAASSCRLAL